MITANFIVGNQLIGSGPLVPRLPVKLGHEERPHNAAYFCPACGEVWGRIVVSDKQDYTMERRFCFTHGSGLFQRSFGTMWTHYPREVLIRELRLIAAHLERNPELDFGELVLQWKNYYD